MDLDRVDPDFIKDLEKSDEVTWIIARNLRLNGYHVILPPINVRPSVGQIKDYGDDGDLLIANSVVEVKRRPDLHFSGLRDFPYETIIVDVVHHWESMKVKPSYYIIVNADLTGAIVVNGNTRDKWMVSRRWDGKRNRERTFFLVGVEYCNYWDFSKTPKFKFS